MKRIVFIICNILIVNLSVSAQSFEPVTVRAGMKIGDCFSFNERYRFPRFVNGIIQLNNGVYSEASLNYDFLNGDMEYIRNRDTLAIANGADIKFVVVAQDTFYYYKGSYLEQVSGGQVMLAVKQYFKLKETLQKDSYGTSSSGAATNSFGSLPSGGDFYKLTANEDMVFQRTLNYYLSNPDGGFLPVSKKNILKLYPSHNDSIKVYLKSHKVSFDDRDDLIRLAEYLNTL